jgi:hypothetical protein
LRHIDVIGRSQHGAMRGFVVLVAIALTATACTAPRQADVSPADAAEVSPGRRPAAPPVPDGALEPAVAAAVDRLIAGGSTAPPDHEALAVLADSGDARLAWIIADLMRFAVVPGAEGALGDAFAQLAGADPRDPGLGANAWLAATNLLIGWDLPAPPGYAEQKARLLLAIEPAWEPFLADPEGTLDLRHLTWGGVFIDDRALGGGEPCRRACIPALDDPALTPAAGGDWYADDRPVFGIALGGEAVALPKHIMEVHEMVNLTLGGRRLGVPYCTLCASAQAFLTDAVPSGVEPLVLRTSGLLSLSNKVMYDLATGSAFHTFTGRAATGPLRQLDFTLDAVTVTVATWGDWKAAHPDTRIVARDGGIGRSYPDDPLCGRDDAGPIFPMGLPDTRLPEQAAVLGVIDPAGQPVAFAADLARAELDAGRPVALGDVELTLDRGGLRAHGPDGSELASHQAFWFAWSQFHPGTALWAPPDVDAAASPPPAAGSVQASEGCSDLFDVLDR